MKTRSPIRCAGCASLALIVLLANPHNAAGAQELSAKELKKAVKQAAQAFDAGRLGPALELYDQILTSTSGADARRGEALYASAVIRLAAESGHQDVGAARRQLEELATGFPRHPRRLEISTLRSLLDGLDSAAAEIKRRSAELEEKTAACDAEREQAEAERQQAAGDRVRSLESQLRKARAELGECRSELEKKEQALQKLRNALVGG